MKEPLILTIDIGSQSCRVGLFNKKGETIGFAKKKYEPVYFSPKSGYAEQNADYFFECICAATKELIKTNKDDMENVIGITMDTFRDSAVMLDENFKPLHPIILWLDQRLAKADEKLPWWDKALFSLVGMKDTIELNRHKTIALWYKENMPELWAKCAHYTNISGYLTYRLVGEYKDSPSSHVGHYPIDFKKREFYKSNKHFKGRIFGIDIEKLPELVPVGEVIGKITKEASKLTGLKEGIPFYSCGSDKSCESLGVGALENHIAAVSYGTASTIEVTNKKFYESEPFLPAYPACIPGYYNMDVQIYRGFWMLNWFVEQFSHLTQSKKTIEEILNDFNKKLDSVPPGCEGLLLQPYWQPGLARPLAKGSMIGFSDTTSSVHFYRAIIEGIAFALREALEHFEKKQHNKVKEIMISGGGSRSDEICQITADIFGLPVSRVQTFETSSLGAAMAGFLAAKEFASPEQAVKEMVHKSVTFKPDTHTHAVYESIYRNSYIRMYPRLKPIYKGFSKHVK